MLRCVSKKDKGSSLRLTLIKFEQGSTVDLTPFLIRSGDGSSNVIEVPKVPISVSTIG